MTNDFTMPTIISVKQSDTTLSIKLDRSDTNVREMLELFEKLLIGHGYQKESINDTIFNMANEIREDAKKLEVMFETDFSNNDTINKIIRKYS